MGITVNMNSIKISLDSFAKVSEKQVIDILSRVGEEFVNDTRSQPQSHEAGTYIDRSSALRSSVGYFILRNGEIIKSKIEPVSGGKLSSKGIETSKQIVSNLVQFEGYRLVGIAGMKYASFVESKGYNVMSKQKEVAIINLKEYFSYVA